MKQNNTTTKHMENKSAVEWFTKQLKYAYDSKKAVGSELDIDDINHLSVQAKQMEKKQIIDSWEDGKGSFSTRQPEQYYKEIYLK